MQHGKLINFFMLKGKCMQVNWIYLVWTFKSNIYIALSYVDVGFINQSWVISSSKCNNSIHWFQRSSYWLFSVIICSYTFLMMMFANIHSHDYLKIYSFFISSSSVDNVKCQRISSFKIISYKKVCWLNIVITG